MNDPEGMDRDLRRASIDAINKINVQIAHIDELAHSIEQCRAATCTPATRISLGQHQLRLLRNVHGRNGMLLIDLASIVDAQHPCIDSCARLQRTR